jgi:nucleoside-diphosphate-sugar epimerase
VVVLGAGGFIGRHVVAALRQEGWPVRAGWHSQRPILPGDVDWRRVDIRDAKTVMHAVAGAGAVVNCAGAKADEPESETVNVGGVDNLIAAAQATGGRRIIHISTQAVKLPRPGRYARTKREGDRRLLASGLPVTLLRPSVVYGAGHSGVFSTMERLVNALPMVPVLGDGTWRCAPLLADDVAQAVVACLKRPETAGRIYDLGGPEEISLDGLIDRLAALNGRDVRKLHVPYVLSLWLARASSAVLRRPPISVSNVLGSNQELVIDSAPARRELDFRPVPLAQGIQRMSGGTTDEPVDVTVAAEARRLARYLWGEELPAELQARYAAAVAQRLSGRQDRFSVLAERHPWLLPYLDAAAGIWRPESALRQRLLVMAAVAEASPWLAPRSLQAWPKGRCSLIRALLSWGAKAGGKATVGLFLGPLVLLGHD